MFGMNKRAVYEGNTYKKVLQRVVNVSEKLRDEIDTTLLKMI